jgi:hypothetical protein
LDYVPVLVFNFAFVFVFISITVAQGEPMSETEIKECMRALLGEDAQHKLDQMKELTARDFAEHILGFEPLKQDDEVHGDGSSP